jgi:hypothetical protein
MNITTADIERAISLAEKYYSQAQIRNELISARDKQRREESELTETPICSERDLDKLRDRLGSIDSAKVREALTEYFFDGSIMKVMFCIFESILAHQGKLAYGGLRENERIRHWIRADKQIGSESVFGYAITTSFDDEDNLLVAKAPRSGFGSSDSIHEYIVGAFALNELRKYLPNFAYVFGTFDCASPVIGQDKWIDTWCGYQPGVHYVLYENVSPAKSLGEANRSIPFPQFLNYYLQVLLSLRLAHKMYDFTHYDLHDQNVLIRNLGRWVAVEYETHRAVEYIETDTIATIIDYGQSHVKIDGKHFGYFGLEAYGTSAAHSFPLFDAYKLLLMSMRTMKTSGNPAFDGAATILEFFTSENPDKVVKKQAEYYYSLPRTKQTLALSLDNLIDYILKLYPRAVVSTSTYPLLKCRANRCKSPQAALKWVSPSKEPAAADMIELYDLSTKLEQEDRAEDEKRLLESYPYFQQIGGLMKDLTEFLARLKENATSFSNPGLGTDPKLYRKRFDEYAVMVDEIDEVSLGFQALYRLTEDYKDKDTFDKLRGLRATYDDIMYYLYRLGEMYLQDLTTIEESVKKERGGREGRSLPEKMRIPWLLDIFPGQLRTVIKTLNNVSV